MSTTPNKKAHDFGRRVDNLIASFRNIPEDSSRSYLRETRTLAEALAKVTKKYDISGATPEQGLRERWAEIVGQANAVYSHPLRIGKGGKLLVLVNHAVVRDELRLLEAMILPRIRSVSGFETVTGLTMRMA